jgi:SOS regulatory protein LexA
VNSNEQIKKEFQEFLKAHREEKGYSVRGLAELTGVSHTYLSQVETGKRGIPKPEILKKLHKPLGVEYQELMEKAGYITPEIEDETLKLIESKTLEELIEAMAESVKTSFTDNNGVINEDIAHYFIESIKQSDPEMTQEDIRSVVYGEEFFEQLFEKMTINEQIEFLNMTIKEFDALGLTFEKDVLKKKKRKNQAKALPTISVPILGYIAAGCPILANDHIEDWTEIPNMWNLKDNEVFILKVKGDSMIGSRIYEGDMVVVKIQQDVESGEIAAVNVNGEEATLKRVKKMDDGQVVLYPDNPKYGPIFITHENARIIGKVIQVLFEPKKAY